MFHTSGRRNHRNAIIALAFLAVITIAGYYLAPADATQNEETVEGTSATTAVTTNAAGGEPDICSDYSETDLPVSCSAAVAIAANSYPGNVTGITIYESEGTGMPFWDVQMLLNSVVQYRNKSVQGYAEVMVDEYTGAARLYQYTGV